MRIWIYGKDRGTVQDMASRIPGADAVVGTSVPAVPGAAFPQGGLVQAVCAAIRGELDILLVSGRHLLGHTPRQVGETEKLFRHYGVTVKSRSSAGSSNS